MGEGRKSSESRTATILQHSNLWLCGKEVAMSRKGIKRSLIAAILVFGLAPGSAAFAAERITGTVVDPGAVSGRSTTVPFSIGAAKVRMAAGILSVESFGSIPA